MNESIVVNRWLYTTPDEGSVIDTLKLTPQAETENLSPELYTIEDDGGNYVAFLTHKNAEGVQHEVCVPFRLLKVLMQHVLHEEVLESLEVKQPVDTTPSDLTQ